MNILFITADQWRAECLSGLGHLVRTPNLDALAADGLLFERHYANAAPCGPSRASMHTSLYQRDHQVTTNGVPLDARFTNWALELGRLGYETALFGYTDTADERPDAPGVLRGMTPVVELGQIDTDNEPWAAWLRARGYPVPSNADALYTTRKPGVEWEDGGAVPLPLALPAELHDTRFMVDQVIDYVRGRENWSVHLSLLRPHPPWIAPEPYNELYSPDALPPPLTQGDESPHPFLDHVHGKRGYRAPDEPRLKRMQASYFGLMTEVDENLGRLFDAVKAEGAWDSTLVLFTSDHGEQLGDHGLIGKLGFYDASYHVPLIIRDPIGKRTGRVARFTESVDLMPTILDWSGLDIPAQCDGGSLLAPDCGREYARWHFDFANTGPRGLGADQCRLEVTRDTRYKYVEFPALPPMLFDLLADAGEMVNLAPRKPSVVARMSERAWSSET